MLKYSPFCIPHFHSVFLKPKSIIDSITCEIKISGIKLQTFLTQYQLLITNSFFEHWFMNNRGRTMVTSSSSTYHTLETHYSSLGWWLVVLLSTFLYMSSQRIPVLPITTPCTLILIRSLILENGPPWGFEKLNHAT